MKRQLLQSVKVLPYTSAAIIDRAGFLSCIFAANIGTITGSPTMAKLKLELSECDEAQGTYTPCKDPLAVVGGKDEVQIGITGSVTRLDINVDLDFIGCKRFIKITPTVSFVGGSSPTSTNTYAIAMGDSATAPV